MEGQVGGRRTSTRGAALCAALALSAVTTAVAGAERWWPACVPGDLDAAACLLAQDHAHDVLPAAGSAVPLGTSAPWASASLVLLAVALVLAWTVGAPGRSPARRRGTAALVAVVGAGLLVLAVDTAGAGGDRLLPTALVVPAVLSWWVGLPAAWVALVAGPGSGFAASPTLRRTLLTVLLLASAPGAGVVADLTYVSHDTTPWGEAWSAAALVLAAGTTALTARGPRPGPRPGSGDRVPVPVDVDPDRRPVGG